MSSGRQQQPQTDEGGPVEAIRRAPASTPVGVIRRSRTWLEPAAAERQDEGVGVRKCHTRSRCWKRFLV